MNWCETHSVDEARPDLRALGVQGDANGPVLDATGLKALTGLAYVLDGLCVVLPRGNQKKKQTGGTHRSNQSITDFETSPLQL